MSLKSIKTELLKLQAEKNSFLHENAAKVAKVKSKYAFLYRTCSRCENKSQLKKWCLVLSHWYDANYDLYEFHEHRLICPSCFVVERLYSEKSKESLVTHEDAYARCFRYYPDPNVHAAKNSVVLFNQKLVDLRTLDYVSI